MSPPSPFGLKESQLLLAQVLHDVVSLFTSLSAGIDLVQDTQSDVWDLVKHVKGQLYVQIRLIRFLLTPGDGNKNEAFQLLLDYGNAMNIQVSGSIAQLPKIMANLGFWLMKQCRTHEGGHLHLNGLRLEITSDFVRGASREDELLQQGGYCLCAPESYAVYIFQLLQQKEVKVKLTRNPGSLFLELLPRS